MTSTARRNAAAITAVAAAGVSSVFLGAAPANAAPALCGPSGTLVAAGICEQTFTTSGTFTHTAQMSTLEVLLVGAGGNGAYSTAGYAAGGGGEVKVVDFSTATTDLTVTVPAPGSPTTVVSGALNASAANGLDGSDVTGVGGASGNGNAGGPSTGGGGGAGGVTLGQNGGTGLVVNTLVSGTSLFSNDTLCYGGGGASGAGSAAAGCGGGYPDDPSNTALVAPTANSGGGGGALPSSASATTILGPGAAGVVVVRWNAPTVTVSFDANGHGTAPAAETIPGGAAPTKPADPTATGFQFDGWYTDASLTTPADFSAGAVADTTFFAKWTAVLAPTGVEVNPIAVSTSIAAVALGATLLLIRTRRRRIED